FCCRTGVCDRRIFSEFRRAESAEVDRAGEVIIRFFACEIARCGDSLGMTRAPTILKSALLLCFFLALTAATRCYNFHDVFIGGKIYFVDADCYSRMTRVRMVLEHPGIVIRHHDFENFPQGTTAHTTAPMDYLIAAMAMMLKPFSTNCIDLAGAVVSPLLGVLTTAFLFSWSRPLRHRFR